MDVHWVVLPRGDVAEHWSGLYVTLNRTGSIVMSRVTHERLGSPEAFLLMFDQFNRLLGLKPAGMGERKCLSGQKIRPPRSKDRKGISARNRVCPKAAGHDRIRLARDRPRRKPDTPSG